MRRGQFRRWVAVGAALPLIVAPVLVAAPASADDVSSGLWYVDALHIKDAHAAGFTGAGVTVAIMDGPVNMQVPTLVGSNVQVQEPSVCLDDSGAPLPSTSVETSGSTNALHGTDVASVLSGTGAGYDGEAGVVGVAPGATVLFYAMAYDTADSLACPHDVPDPGFEVEDALATDINDAIDKGADIISISLGLNGSGALTDAIARAHREGVVVLGAVPNDPLALGGIVPGAMNGVVAVVASDSAAQVLTQAPWGTVAGPGVGILGQGAPGSAWTDQYLKEGSSLATPIVAGFLAMVLQKYPKATGNQLIQTLIHNTGGGNPDLVHTDELGYGIASATEMLGVDPTQYPDTNPLLTDDNSPSIEESTPGATPTATATDPGESTPGSGNPVGFLIVAGIVGLLVVIGLIVLIVILATRRSRTPGHS
ncbi:MAG: S8 family serine peptidase [Rhodoglobus sp.]